jgi:hypothetical protein
MYPLIQDNFPFSKLFIGRTQNLSVSAYQCAVCDKPATTTMRTSTTISGVEFPVKYPMCEQCAEDATYFVRKP